MKLFTGDYYFPASETSIITVRSNLVPRMTLEFDELTPKEQAEFDYEHGATFVRYKGWVYDVGEFMRINHMPTRDDWLAGWHGMHSESVFSGVLVHLVDGTDDMVIMGRYYA